MNEEARARCRSLIRQAQGIDRILTGTRGYPPLADYFDQLPKGGQEEILYRFERLRERMEEFQAARGSR